MVCQLAPEGTTEKADEGWRAIRAGLIRGLSVGFIGKDWDSLPTGGRRFTEWEVIELSAVAVPANADAAILEVKKLDQQQVADPQPRAEEGFLQFPRSLSNAERGLLAEGAASRWAGEIMAKGAKAGVQMTASEKMLFKALSVLLVQQRWNAERLEELEGAANDH